MQAEVKQIIDQTIQDFLTESKFQIYNKSLCPALWDENKHLDPVIRVNLLKIANDFYKKTKLIAPLEDIWLMGSIANFNWTPDSDIDVHLLIDFSKLKMPMETAVKISKTSGAQWNNEHNVSIKGFKVELNLQSVNAEKPYVMGIYSLVKDVWIRNPSHLNVNIDKVLVQDTYHKMKKYFELIIQSGDVEKMKGAKDYLDDYRQIGLDNGGELSIENIVYKILRSKGILKKLKDTITSTYDGSVSISENDKDDLLNRHFSNLNDDNLYVTVNNVKELPAASYIQIDNVIDGDNIFSSNPEKLKQMGYNIPSTEEFLKLPSGKYKLSDAKKKLNLSEEFFDDKKLSPLGLPIGGEEKYSKQEPGGQMMAANCDEVVKKDINSVHPKSRDMWDKDWNPILNKFTLSNLKAIEDKISREPMSGEMGEDYYNKRMELFLMIHNEIKRRLNYINKPVNEFKKFSLSHKDVHGSDGFRGPHTPNESDLLIAGKKPAAVIETRADLKKLEPYVKSGKLLHKICVGQKGFKGHKYNLFAIPSEAWRLNKLCSVLSNLSDNTNMNMFHARMGILLGYDKEDIRKFIALEGIYMHRNVDCINKPVNELKERVTLRNTQALLLSNPPELIFTINNEHAHIDIFHRVFHDEMEELMTQFQNDGYGDSDDETCQYPAANKLAKKYGVARVIIEYDGILYVNTPNNIELTNGQLRTLKNFCIENSLRLVHSIGIKKREIELNEGVGAGRPEDDRLHIPGERWRIKWDTAPKTPLMKEESNKDDVYSGYITPDFKIIAVREDLLPDGEEGHQYLMNRDRSIVTYDSFPWRYRKKLNIAYFWEKLPGVDKKQVFEDWLFKKLNMKNPKYVILDSDDVMAWMRKDSPVRVSHGLDESQDKLIKEMIDDFFKKMK